ncbi:protein arginine methyltransferase NDUFAF7 homolog, mitochondrial isoform X2 [Herrania umbratica]|uniref:Protein arginine methyltransferase NDUFAF7 n=1 Tax=Herrania umbratica TaxID=108875 RepID=A0A6J1AXR6_9ROSI|nr:protein arginine methyltransferase NDUFAF7 homolog, mitochondrial isoform X2 [Herrania umbratica]
MLSRSHTKKKLLPFIFSKLKVTTNEPFTSPFQALFSTHIVGEKPILVRDFIHRALYDPKHGYFSQRSGSVGVLERSIKFNQLEGRKAYMKHLDKIYKQSGIAWFTPVELFKPWYAQGIAEAIMRTANLSVPLKIYEIGGGSGTCAKGIMDYIMLNAPPRVYNMEISPALAEIQKQTVGEVHGHLSKFKVEHRDATDRSGWGDVEQQPCWVIMLEVLDNLPHDLIYSENQVSPWMEVWVEKQLDREGLSELYKPLQDSLIKCCLEILELDKSNTNQSSAVSKAWSKLFPKPRRCWLPTGCMKLLEVLHAALPKMSLIASDFSYLPDVKIPGERAPLVSTKKDGCSSDYSNYLDAKGEADIFFPTDFWLLERIDHYCSGWLKLQKDKSSTQGKRRRTITLDTSSFMEEFGLPSKTRTKDGYNPLLDDFKNTKFYLSVPTHNIK